MASSPAARFATGSSAASVHGKATGRTGPGTVLSSGAPGTAFTAETYAACTQSARAEARGGAVASASSSGQVRSRP